MRVHFLSLAALVLFCVSLTMVHWSRADDLPLLGVGTIKVVAGGGGGTGVAPLLDSHCSGICIASTNGTNTISTSGATLTTAGANRLIVVYLISANNTGTGSAPTGAAPTFSTPTSTNGLTYTLHKRYAFTGTSTRCNTGGAGCFVNVEVWTAIATAQISATPEAITATATGTAGAMSVVVSAYFLTGSIAWGASPFDPNASLGNHVEGNDTVFASQTGKSITNNGTLGLMFGVTVTNAGPAVVNANGSWVSAGNIINQVSTNPWIALQVLNQPFTTSQSGTFGYTSTVGGGGGPPFGDWSVLLDALSS